jgi:hypothetical protein
MDITYNLTLFSDSWVSALYSDYICKIIRSLFQMFAK